MNAWVCLNPIPIHGKSNELYPTLNARHLFNSIVSLVVAVVVRDLNPSLPLSSCPNPRQLSSTAVAELLTDASDTLIEGTKLCTPNADSAWDEWDECNWPLLEATSTTDSLSLQEPSPITYSGQQSLDIRVLLLNSSSVSDWRTLPSTSIEWCLDTSPIHWLTHSLL